MSGHFRFRFAAFLLVAGFATPAASNPFTDLFLPNAVPEAAAATSAPAQEECLLQPGKSTAPGQHWVYRHDGHRKCWFQAEVGTALAGKPLHRHAERQHAAPGGNQFAERKEEEAFADARDELRSTPAETSEPASHASEIKLGDTTPIPATSAAALAPTAPVVGNAASDQVTSERSTPPQLKEEALLAAARALPDVVDTSANSEAPVAVLPAEASEDGRWSWARWLGALLIILGGVALLSSRLRRPARVG
jgi:hypothetical protein